MDDLKQSMIDNIKYFVMQFSDSSNGIDINAYINYYKGLNVTPSFGVGNLSSIPFISFLGDGQYTQKGIYPVILFYRLRNTVFLSYGISETNEPDISWNIDNAETAGEFFKREKIKLSNPEKKYNDSLIFKSYPLDTLPIEELVDDLDDIIEVYKNLLINSGLNSTVPFQRPPRSKNEKRERFVIGNLKFTTDPTIEDDSNPNNDDSDANDMETPKFETIQKIFFGTPGGGKSFRVKKFIEEERGAKDRYFRVTFHPDTDYASFVGSYKPIMKGNEITYEYVPQVFTRAYIAAWNDQEHEYFIDIEEINRGNCAQIFGDLFQLLDRKSDTGLSEYPVKADADLCYYLTNAVDEDGNPILKNKDGIKNNELRLPANLSIVATMNTSDQSLFPMDSAFKRRWDWEYVPSTFKEEDNYNIIIGGKTYKWHKFLKEVNDKIKDVTDSEDKQMGAYFIKRNVDEEAFKSKVMYYLWSEICKEEYKTQNNFFRSKIKVDGNTDEKEFTFNELYPDGAKLLIGFMKYLKVKPVEQAEEDEEESGDE
jgi:hypothetical protein